MCFADLIETTSCAALAFARISAGSGARLAANGLLPACRHAFPLVETGGQWVVIRRTNFLARILIIRGKILSFRAMTLPIRLAPRTGMAKAVPDHR
jgi:hypothetical protein